MSVLLKNIIKLGISSSMAKIIGFAAIPIITRLYNPEFMGVSSSMMSIILILSSISTLKTAVAIPLPKRDSTATIIVIFSSVILFLYTLFIALTIILLNTLDIVNPKFLLISEYLYIMPMAVFLIGLNEIVTNYFIRKKSFNRLSLGNIIQSLIGNGIKLLPLIFPVNVIFLIGGTISTSGLIGVLYLPSLYTELSRNRIKINIKVSMAILYRYKDIPFYRTLSQFILVLASNLPILYFSCFFDANSTGILALTISMVNLPIVLVAQSIGQAYYGEIANLGKHNIRQIEQLTVKLVKRMLLVSSIPFLIIAFFGEEIFSILFGGEWQKSGEYASIMSIYLIFNLLVLPVINVLNVIEKNHLYLRFNLQRLALIMLSLAISNLISANEVLTIKLYSAFLSLQYLFVLINILRIIRKG
jgi:O-antigen/teichoic acid export membrane protein